MQSRFSILKDIYTASFQVIKKHFGVLILSAVLLSLPGLIVGYFVPQQNLVNYFSFNEPQVAVTPSDAVTDSNSVASSDSEPDSDSLLSQQPLPTDNEIQKNFSLKGFSGTVESKTSVKSLFLQLLLFIADSFFTVLFPILVTIVAYKQLMSDRSPLNITFQKTGRLYLKVLLFNIVSSSFLILIMSAGVISSMLALLFMIPGFYLIISIQLSLQVIVNEGYGVIDSIKRSFYLMKGIRRSYFLVVFSVGIWVVALISLLANRFGGANGVIPSTGALFVLYSVLSQSVIICFLLLMSVIQTAFYIHQRKALGEFSAAKTDEPNQQPNEDEL